MHYPAAVIILTIQFKYKFSLQFYLQLLKYFHVYYVHVSQPRNILTGAFLWYMIHFAILWGSVFDSCLTSLFIHVL